jgi:hypothetical protein
VRIAILQGSPTGTVVYQELFNPNPQTNANGLVSIEIGMGLPIIGTFSSIKWADGPFWLKAETDPTGGTSYTVVGTSELISVPYALYSETAESIPNNIVTSAKITDGTIAAVDLGTGSVTSAKIADGTIASADLADGSITSAKIQDGTIVTADLADGTVTTAKIADGNVATADLANNAVISAKIADETITAADIQNITRNISFPASSINYSATSTVITQTGNGLTWKSDYSNAAFITIAKPSDWLETSNVTLKLYFMENVAAGGVVAFFIRPRSYNPGDTFADASSQSPDSPVTVAANGTMGLYAQTFTIPYNRFGTKSLWVITMQRQGTGETFTDDLILMAVELIYTAVQ